jgi:Transmembrane exosortase (Exosortase_EpsH).
MDRKRLTFLLTFLGVVVVLYAIIAINPVNDHVIVPFTKFITRAACVLLNAADQNVVVEGTIIRSKSFAVDVENGCNGIEAIILLIAAIGAFPAGWRQKAIGIVGGFFVIEVLNTFRVAMLFWLGEHFRRFFQLFHVAVWQSIIILLTVGLFLLWSWKIATPHAVADGR